MIEDWNLTTGWMPFLPLNQQRQSTEGYVQPTVYSIFREMIISVIFPIYPFAWSTFIF